MFGWSGPCLCPQWSTPRKWAINTSQSLDFSSGTKCAITPLSTVWRSMRLKDGNGKDLWNDSGNRLPQVSSPINVMFFPSDLSWEITLSSMIFEPAKLLPASTKVGKLPSKQRGVNSEVEIPVSCSFRNSCVTVTATTKYQDQGMVLGLISTM